MQRRIITVSGVVQGVGFRPFVYGLASKLSLYGFVLNEAGTVRIEIEGASEAVDEFTSALTFRPPPLAKIDRLTWRSQAPAGFREFRIESSQTASLDPIFIAPDVTSCAACLAELFDARDRRFRYPFINCTNCGPRLTIIRGVPYDRAQTTMAAFAMCAACRREYENPNDRRFHAEPIACAACGPQLELRVAAGELVRSGDPFGQFVEALQSGLIGAIKGLGGFHLTCDAANERAVAELRQRKHRDEKPFAVMLPDVETISDSCHLDEQEQSLLESAARPIVLLRKRGSIASEICEAVAPGNHYLGVMLPYTPLHFLLIDAMQGRALVMTSGNRSDEPIAFRDEDAIASLAGIADVFLGHNRPIHLRCDDSIVKHDGGKTQLVRRSRGYAPYTINLPHRCDVPVLAVGGQLKNVFALARDESVYLSHHLGDLDHFRAFQQFERDVRHYEKLFHIRPQVIVHDLHPDYASTQYAIRRADAEQLPRIAVQHHHAHMASCMADNGLTGSVIGISFDGTGYGIDEQTGKATIWGGEFLVGDYGKFRRAAHLRNVCLPGGEQAVREPWRMAAAYLFDADCELASWQQRIDPRSRQTVRTMIERQINTPQTSSVGRLFDAVASLIGVRDRSSYEGQAATELENLAAGATYDGEYPFAVAGAADDSSEMPETIDTRPAICAIVKDCRAGVDTQTISRRFHSTLAQICATTCRRIRDQAGLDRVVFSGGVFLNSVLLEEASQRLVNEGFEVFRHRQVPTNDGGLSLGQIAVATAQRLHSADSRASGHVRPHCDLPLATSEVFRG